MRKFSGITGHSQPDAAGPHKIQIGQGGETEGTKGTKGLHPQRQGMNIHPYRTEGRTGI